MGYLELRENLLDGDAAEYTCLVGTMVQEAYATHPDVRDACRASILGHAGTLVSDFGDLIAAYGAPATVTATGLAEHTQTVLQGSFVLAKATDDASARHRRHRPPAPLSRAALPRCCHEGEPMIRPARRAVHPPVARNPLASCRCRLLRWGHDYVRRGSRSSW